MCEKKCKILECRSYTPRKLRACCSQSKFTQFKSNAGAIICTITLWTHSAVFTHAWASRRLYSYFVLTKNIEKRSQNSYTTPCNGVVSRGAQIGGIQVFDDHTRGNKRKQNMRPRSQVCTQCGVSRMFIFTLRSEGSTYATWRITVILIAGKTRITQPEIWASCRCKNIGSPP